MSIYQNIILKPYFKTNIKFFDLSSEAKALMFPGNTKLLLLGSFHDTTSFKDATIITIDNPVSNQKEQDWTLI